MIFISPDANRIVCWFFSLSSSLISATEEKNMWILSYLCNLQFYSITYINRCEIQDHASMCLANSQ